MFLKTGEKEVELITNYELRIMNYELMINTMKFLICKICLQISP